MSRVSGVWKGIAVIAGLALSNMGLAADDDAVFFTSDDCTGDGYVWDARGEPMGWTAQASTPVSQVVGTNKRVYVPDPAASPAIVDYNSRLAPGGCVVQPGSDQLVRAIPMGFERAGVQEH